MLRSQSGWVVLLPALFRQCRSLEHDFEDRQRRDGQDRQHRRPRWLPLRDLVYKHPQLDVKNGQIPSSVQYDTCLPVMIASASSSRGSRNTKRFPGAIDRRSISARETSSVTGIGKRMPFDNLRLLTTLEIVVRYMSLTVYIWHYLL